jgi:hypothetical protein
MSQIVYEITERGKKMVEDPRNWGDIPPEKIALVRKIIAEYAETVLTETEDAYTQRFLLQNPDFLEIT